MALNSTVVKSCLVGSLGGLLFGFDTAVISGTTHALTRAFDLSPSELGITVSIALWGTVMGAMTSGALGDRTGGRSALRLMALFYLISSVGCGVAWNWPTLLIFRFIGGLAVGGSSVLGPVYIAELAPARWRGRLVGMFQVNVVLGIVVAYLSNYGIALMKVGTSEWRYEFAVAAIPALIFGLFLFTVPNSPRWLVAQNRIEEARTVLGQLGEPSVDAELQEIVHSIHFEQETKQEPVFQRRYATPIFLAIVIGAFNQLAGINAILYYLNDIFAGAGFSQLSSNVMAVAVGTANLISTLIGMAMIDKLGRKSLLLIGSLGTATSLLGAARLFHSGQSSSSLLGLLISYMFFFSISQGAVIWVYISEIFPTKVRSKGHAIGSSAHWIMNAVIAFIFPLVAAHSRTIPFVFFAGMMILQFFIVLRFFPETKGKTLEEIQEKLGLG
jgi:SP family arabinose:H+ symporter-like MFS transporter